jgi:hypothetical protein
MASGWKSSLLRQQIGHKKTRQMLQGLSRHGGTATGVESRIFDWCASQRSAAVALKSTFIFCH